MLNLIVHIDYELLPEYTERSQLTDLFIENKFWGWTGLLTIFLLICIVLIFQLKQWEGEDKIANKKINDWRSKAKKSKNNTI